MEPTTYTFAGDFVTYLGFLGIFCTFLIVTTAFRNFYKSPYNLRVPPTKVTTETTDETEKGVS